MQEMDSVLDEALDELDDDCKATAIKRNGNPLDDSQGSQNSPVGHKIQNDISGASDRNCEKKRNDGTTQHIPGEASQQYKPQSVEEALGSLLEEMNRTNFDDLGQEDDFLREMLGLSDGGTENFDADLVIDGMMEQLLSKELMYEPLKQVMDKFPNYLDQNKPILSAEEYQQRCKQHMGFKQLIKAYEEEPSNTKKLMELMQEVQKYGQPPVEIIREIAPGLELDGDGMPAMNLLNPGTGDEECCIM